MIYFGNELINLSKAIEQMNVFKNIVNDWKLEK